jgi:energy-coupling factor transport system substrate-specific component
VTKAALHRGLLVAANVIGLVAFAWPFLLPAAVGGDTAHSIDAPFIFAALMVCLGTVLFVQLGRGGMGPKAVALMAVLGAMMVALRLPGFVAGYSAMFIVVLLAGNAFGPAFGFVLGAVGTFASGLFIGGLGPWLPFQMIAVGWVGAGAGLVPRSDKWLLRVGALAVYGFVAAFAFGAVMNLWFWPFAARGSAIGWAPELGADTNVRHYAAFYLATSLAWDAFGAVGNLAAVLVLGRPLLRTLDRAARRMRLSVTAPDKPRPRSSIRGTAFSVVTKAHNRMGVGRVTAAAALAIEESPDSTGQDAGENPRRGDPRTVPQRADRPGSRPR